MASNKVGHYIYGLKDRVWPDFVCHLSLFCQSKTGILALDSSWHLDSHIPEVAARSPIAIKSKYKFSTQQDKVLSTSSLVLSKFGFPPTVGLVSSFDSSPDGSSPAA